MVSLLAGDLGFMTATSGKFLPLPLRGYVESCIGAKMAKYCTRERTVALYTIDRSDWAYLERVWDYCQNQGRNIAMYKTRLTPSYTAWVVELPRDSKYTTMFLLQFGGHCTNVMGTYYC